MKKRVLLAFSGGLDTSFSIPYLKNERGYQVHSVMVNCGGFTKEEEERLSERALQLGAVSHKNIDALELYYQKGIRYLLFGNILKNSTYPLSVSSERVFQAMEVVNYAKELEVDAIAHGSTGAGNDQIRFDLIFEILAPDIEIIAPIRELELSRSQEIEYLRKEGFDFNWESSKYSINQGIWGTSVGGSETLTSDGVLPEEAYPSKVVKREPKRVKIGFRKGEAISLDGVEMAPVELIRELNRVGGEYGVGRDIHVGDTIVGLKGRVAFEAPAPLILIKAHHLLEKHLLTKRQLYWKEQLANQYGELLHEAQYLEPLMRDIESFLEQSQKYVTGVVEVELREYHFWVIGASSKYDLMNSKFGHYGEESRGFGGEEIRGFTKIVANPLKNYYSIERDD